MSESEKKLGVVARLLTPKELDSVSGGSYAKTTPEYCQYTQGPTDGSYKQTCPVPKEDAEILA